MNTSNKTEQHQEQFFQLLRLSMGVTEQKDFVATDEDWQWLHEEADRQSLIGVIYGAMIQLPANQQPPVDLLINMDISGRCHQWQERTAQSGVCATDKAVRRCRATDSHPERSGQCATLSR